MELSAIGVRSSETSAPFVGRWSSSSLTSVSSSTKMTFEVDKVDVVVVGVVVVVVVERRLLTADSDVSFRSLE